MEKLIAVIVIVHLMLFTASVANWLAWLQTETRYRIPLNFKPFTCRPCMSFWLTFLLNVPLCLESARVLNSGYVLYFSLYIALLFGFISYFYNKSKNIVK